MDRTKIIGGVAVVAILAGIGFNLVGIYKNRNTSTELQCTVDDSLSFTATGVTYSNIRDGALIVILDDNFPIHRNMLPGETCTRVDEIDWSLAR